MQTTVVEFYRSLPLVELIAIPVLAWFFNEERKRRPRTIRLVLTTIITFLSLVIAIVMAIGTLGLRSVPILKFNDYGIEYTNAAGIKRRYAWNDIVMDITRRKKTSQYYYTFEIYSKDNNTHITSINFNDIALSKRGILYGIKPYYYIDDDAIDEILQYEDEFKSQRIEYVLLLIVWLGFLKYMYRLYKERKSQKRFFSRF